MKGMFLGKWIQVTHELRWCRTKLRKWYRAQQNQMKVIFGARTSCTQSMVTYTSKKPYQGDVCSKSFAVRWGTFWYLICARIQMNNLISASVILTKHVQNHTVEWPHKCDICSKSFSLKGPADQSYENIYEVQNPSYKKAMYYKYW